MRAFVGIGARLSASLLIVIPPLLIMRYPRVGFDRLLGGTPAADDLPVFCASGGRSRSAVKPIGRDSEIGDAINALIAR
jgi:hypothetical protein